MADYLREVFEIEQRGLDKERDEAPLELRTALELIWLDKHRKRRERFGTPLDETTIAKLVRHDVESYSGITQ
ncbi:MAG TPA: hypothetical protein VEZ51_03880, partial [Gemmatimonadaceae bacterium]|nr:hypothetical protein [Gemmatimonadaceae bacterium]